MARPRASDYAEKRQRIRDRAAELFAERGFAASSTADIARAARCSKALIYHYFGSKEEILYDLLNAHVGALVEAAEVAIASTTEPRARFRALVRAHLRLYASARAKHVLLLNELSRLAPAKRARIIALERRLVALAGSLIARVAPGLARRPKLVRPLTMSFYGLINWTYTWYRADGPLGPEAFADLASDLFLDGVGRAVSRRTWARA